MSMYGVSSSRPVLDTGTEGGAQQHFKDECDINVIMAKYRTTGLVSHVQKNQGRFADVSQFTTFHDASLRLLEARDFFRGLPANLRAEFGNDPARFLDFMGDPSNMEEIRRLGLEETLNAAEAAVKAPKEPPKEPEAPAPDPKSGTDA